ncbi:GAF domain-containing protein [Jiella mangrovi]|uniref:Blue-light-activated histidine kinase n=1 Tax=Jiella mangrovi TaxID=2821407 RepID=A0ABS4BNK9_9HYPH|nr:GAF domain-containing protein [Jiella mangrovi]MBP0617781.1 GAF domain-containing protein [Jiella mangrovi]
MQASQFRSSRVEALRSSGLLDRSQQEEFGQLTDLVRDILGVPVAIVTLVDEQRQVFAGHSGLPSPWDERGETPMTHSFCQHVVDLNRPLVISDARIDPKLRDNMAIADIGVVAYLGIPLSLPDGQVVGALAAIDSQSREWTETDMRRLRSISQTVEREMSVRVSESRWRSLFETMQEGFILGHVVRDESGEIVDWRYEIVNDAWYDLVGMPKGTAVGRTVREVFPGIEDEWVDEIARVVRSNKAIRFTRQAGILERWYDGAVQPIGSDRFTVIFLEVTDRIAQEKRQTALLRLGDALRNRSTVEGIVLAATLCISEGLAAERIGFGTVDDRTETIDVHADRCAPGIASVAGHHAFRSFGSYIEDLKRGETVAISDVADDDRTSASAAVFASIQIRSLLNLPIIENGRLVLIVFAHVSTSHTWSEDELNFVQQIGDRVQSAMGRVRAEESQRLLNQELAHRMKNSLAMVQAIATQTLRQARTMEEGREAIGSRLSALANAQDILTRANYTGATILEIVDAALAPHQTDDARIEAEGPHIDLTAQQALGISLAIHELATNAAKYGALSNETGRVTISWEQPGGIFRFRWIESNGPNVTLPERRGFGSRLIEKIVASYFDGKAQLDFDPAGIRFTLTGSAHQIDQTSKA